MPLFMCSKCKCIENTALSRYWFVNGGAPLCSECDPKIGKWHGEFEKEIPHGYKQDPAGFIYTPEETNYVKHLGPFHDLVIDKNDDTP